MEMQGRERASLIIVSAFLYKISDLNKSGKLFKCSLVVRVFGIKHL